MPITPTAIGGAIRQLREDRGWTLAELAEKMGWSYTTLLSKKERGEVSIKPPERRKFAEVFGLTLEQFDELWRAQKVHDRPAPTRIPVINRGPAGQVLPYDHDHYADGEYHNALEYVDRSEKTQDPLAFALIIIGDSMEPTFFDGDTVVFSPVHRVPKPTVKLAGGRVVFVRLNQEHGADGVSIGRYQPLSGPDGEGPTFLLTKDNPKHKAIVVQRAHVEQLAVAIEMRSSRGL